MIAALTSGGGAPVTFTLIAIGAGLCGLWALVTRREG